MAQPCDCSDGSSAAMPPADQAPTSEAPGPLLAALGSHLGLLAQLMAEASAIGGKADQELRVEAERELRAALCAAACAGRSSDAENGKVMDGNIPEAHDELSHERKSAHYELPYESGSSRSSDNDQPRAQSAEINMRISKSVADSKSRTATTCTRQDKKKHSADLKQLRNAGIQSTFRSLKVGRASFSLTRSFSINVGRKTLLFFLRGLIGNAWWDTFWSMLILTNVGIMVCEAEYNGMRTGNELGKYDPYGSDEYIDTYLPGAVEFYQWSEIVFAALFTLELMLILSHDVLGYWCHLPDPARAPLWRDPWEILDLFIVVSADVSLAIKKVEMPFNLQVLRILRLVRLMRLVRLLRTFESFDPMIMIMTALKGSLEAEVASLIVLLVFLTLPALGLTTMLQTWYLSEDSHLSEKTQVELFLYFGTYTRSMVSMLELSLANWPPITRFMMEELHEGFAYFCVIIKLTIGFSLISVINGVFIKACFNAADNDDVILVRSRMKEVDRHNDRMNRLFQMADQDGDGELSIEDFKAVVQKPAIKFWLEAMDLRISDADVLFKMIAGSQDSITPDQLVQGIAVLRGAARNIDLVALSTNPIFTNSAKHHPQPYVVHSSMPRDTSLPSSAEPVVPDEDRVAAGQVCT